MTFLFLYGGGGAREGMRRLWEYTWGRGRLGREGGRGREEGSDDTRGRTDLPEDEGGDMMERNTRSRLREEYSC